MKHHIPFLKHFFPRQWLFLKKHIEMGEEDHNWGTGFWLLLEWVSVSTSTEQPISYIISDYMRWFMMMSANIYIRICITIDVYADFYLQIRYALCNMHTDTAPYDNRHNNIGWHKPNAHTIATTNALCSV